MPRAGLQFGSSDEPFRREGATFAALTWREGAAYLP